MAHNFSNTITTTSNGFAGSTPEPLTGTGNAERLNMPPSPNFLYIHHPNRWMIMDGEVLPALHKLHKSPGQDNVSPKNGGDMGGAIGTKVRDGWVMIPHDVIPGGYVKKFDGARGAVHLSVWETPRQVGRRVYDPETDTAGYYAFLRDLMARGIIQQPAQVVLEDIVARAQSAVDRAAAHTATEAGKAIYERELEKLHAVEIACGYRKAKPKTTRKKKTGTRKRTTKPAATTTDTEVVDG